MRTAEDYHIRVLVPCYKESLQILQVCIPCRRCLKVLRDSRSGTAWQRTKFCCGRAYCNLSEYFLHRCIGTTQEHWAPGLRLDHLVMGCLAVEVRDRAGIVHSSS